MLPSALLRKPRKLALIAISVLVTLATVAAFAESYRALYTWALRHEYTGIWAVLFPMFIDSFVLVGELTLFVGLVDRWHWRARVFPWIVALIGLSVSVAGNIGHVTGHDFFTRATAAVAPLAATFGLMVALGTLKRVVRMHHTTALPDLDVEVTADSEGGQDEPQEPLAAILARDGTPLSNGSTGTTEAITAPRTVASHGKPKTRSWSRERRAARILANNPDISGAELGRRLGTTPRTGQRIMNSMGA